ncbi:MAG: carbohydrate ABC transporter permease [Actinobacteria bacterium]|nr:carbohydrate ABC transporter permease [Actinomycetota bacterium]
MALTGAQARRRAARRHVAGRIGLYLTAVGFALFAALPFLWGAITSFKQSPDLYNVANNPFVFNRPPTLEHVRQLLQDTQFPTFVANTAIVGGCVVGITLLLALPAAYALARFPLRWGGALGIGIFFVYLVPPSLLFISLSRLISAVHLQDSKWSLVLVYPTITVPVSMWLLIGFFRSIPKDLEEQAMVDGYSRLAAFARVALPLAFPGIVAVVVFSFTLSAHEFIYALAFNATAAETTLSVGVPTVLIRGDVFFWQALQAATILVAVPIAVVFNLLLERFIAGFTMGAVKG